MPRGIQSDDRWPAIVDLQFQTQMHWKYKIVSTVTGQVAFPGIQVTITDKYGFFRLQKFSPFRQELTLLPRILQPQTTAERVKRDNLQLLSGHHRFRKSGISSELLGLREYQVGDPPRSIAWKATARTGKLMTCEYESEVPIRTTILADLSDYQFWGRPGPAPFDAMASVIGSITLLLIEDKDPVGIVLARGPHRTRISPGLGQRQFVRILKSLLNAHPGGAVAQDIPIRKLETFIWKSIYRMYPELMADHLNVVKLPLLLFGPRRRYQLTVRRQSAIALSWILDQNLASGYKLTFDDVAYREKCNEFFTRHPSVANESFLVTGLGSAQRDKENAI
ncbi:MAG: DUF58 domain-containing protein, partial [Planctomycetota bacterium]|nr:DUF58 domain-containing protein [Planctomycetota bacterium]